MRRGLAAFACIGAVALPAVALGGPVNPEYGGKVDDRRGRYIGFDIKGGADKALKNMFIVSVPFHDCDDPANNGKDGGGFEGVFPIDNQGKFGGTETDMFRRERGMPPTGIKYTLKGRLDGKRAEGTLDMKLLGTNCKSGKVEWEAKKPSPPIPPS